MKLLSVLSTSLDSMSRIVIKAWNGKSDTRTAKQYGSYGLDSNPVKGIVALYGKTELDGAECILGYLNKNMLSDVGEFRIFSTDADGGFKFNLWLRADGTVLIGDSDAPADYINFLVNFNELKTEFDALKQSVNDLISKFNTHTHPYVNVVTPAVTSVTTTPATPNSSNIDNAKNDKLKSI